MTKAFSGDPRHPTRRSFVKLAGAATTLVMAGARSKPACSQPAPAVHTKLGQVPGFNGDVLLDDAALRDVASDNGGHIRRMPLAVLRPKSAGDVVQAVRFANQRGLKIAMRGRGHCQYGQSQVEGGIVIDSAALNGVRLYDSGFLDAQP